MYQDMRVCVLDVMAHSLAISVEIVANKRGKTFRRFLTLNIHLEHGVELKQMYLSPFDSSAVSTLGTSHLVADVPKTNLSLGDGTCSIEIDQTVKDRAITETALSSEIGDVAWNLLNECTFDEHPKGGIATGLGENIPDSSIAGWSCNIDTGRLTVNTDRAKRPAHLDRW